MVLTVIALVIMGIFYAIYFGKMLLQKKKGIKTDQIAESQIHNVEFYTEAVMKAATICVVVVEIASVLIGWSLFPVWVRMVGVCMAVAGDVVFGISVWTMKDSWRAGLARADETVMVTDGIYRVSRNPAFLGFDLVYVGILIMFFNPVLLLFSLFAGIMLHLQILQEEKYLPEVFGEEYLEYKKKAGRYLGLKGWIIFICLLVFVIVGVIFIYSIYGHA